MNENIIPVLHSCIIIFLLILIILLARKQLEFQDTFKRRPVEGLPINELFPALSLVSEKGEVFSTNYPKSNGIIVAITASGCSACDELYQTIRDFNIKMKTKYQFILLNIAEADEEIYEIVNKHKLDSIPIFRIDYGDKLIMDSIKVTSVPFVYLLSNNGRVLSMNTVNNEEHLIELLRNAA